MNCILKNVRHFATTFIDDRIIKSRFFDERFAYLRIIFGIFSKLNVSIKSTKIFFDCLNVILLEQKVNALKLSITTG